MKPNFGSAVLLLSLSAGTTYGVSHASAYEDGPALPSTIDITSRMTQVDAFSARSVSSSFSPLTMVGAMSKMHPRDSLFTRIKRSFNDMNAHTIPLSILARQAQNGGAGTANPNFEEQDRLVNAACEQPIANLTTIVSPASDPAGVAVCYNIPAYDPTTGNFNSDIRLYKIAVGLPEWEASGVRMSLSVEYEGAMVRLAAPPSTASANRNQQRDEDATMVKRQNTASPTPRLVQILRFTGQVNPDVMQNQTIVSDPNILKLLLIPNLILVGNSPSGSPMNASINAAQINYVSGAFSNITTPELVGANEAFVLPGVSIAVIPVGMYLFAVYMILFVGIVGYGSWERYQFRMSYRRKQSIMDGRTGVGKI